MAGAAHDHVNLLVADPIFELHHELQFIGQGGAIGALRLDVEVDVATDSVVVNPGPKEANDRTLAEAALRQSTISACSTSVSLMVLTG